jgi:hypothetical protein
MRTIGRHLAIALALVACAGSGTVARGQGQVAESKAWIGFKNELGFQVVVQASMVTKSGLRKGTPVKISPKEVIWDCVTDKSVRTVVVTDLDKRELAKFDVVANDKNDLLYTFEFVTGKDGKKVVKVKEEAKPPSSRPKPK